MSAELDLESIEAECDALDEQGDTDKVAEYAIQAIPALIGEVRRLRQQLRLRVIRDLTEERHAVSLELAKETLRVYAEANGSPPGRLAAETLRKIEEG